ncbi:MAG: Chromosome partition protein Smc [bacterium ADurb.BinA028]|nr:MAG: Chromosome partition protein Smc [bacterium ADurb.BinA028]
MKTTLAVFFSAVLALLVGCPKSPPPVGPTTPLGGGQPAADARGTATAAQGTLDAAHTERLGRIAADSDAAQKAVSDDRKADAAAALRIQQAHLVGVARNAEERAKLAEAEQHRAEGRAEQAEATLAELQSQAGELSSRLATLERERNEAVAKANDLQAAFTKQAEELGRKQAIAVTEALRRAAEAEDKRKRAALLDQVGKLNWIGVIALIGSAVVLGIGWFAGGIVAIRKAAPVAIMLGAAGAWAFAAAQVIGHPYFLPIMGGLTLLALLLGGWWVRKHVQRGDLAEELKAKTEKLAAISKDVVPILDEAYEKGSATVAELAKELGEKATVRDLLDRYIFDPLSSVMDRPTKNAVHEIRAAK